MHNPEFVLQNETLKLLCDIEIQTDHRILARRTDLVVVNKKKREPADMWTLSFRKKYNYLDFTSEQKKGREHEGDSDTNCNWCTWNYPERIEKETRRYENQRTSGDHPGYSVIKIDQNTEKSPGDLRKFAVTQTAVRKHHLTLLWKTPKRVKKS